MNKTSKDLNKANKQDIDNLEKKIEVVIASASLSLSVNDSFSIWVLSGDLIYDTIPLKIAELEELRPQGSLDKSKRLSSWSIDCRGVKHFDSCGAAFLLSCLRYAKKNRLKLQLIDLPESVFPLLQVQGIAGLISPLVRDVIY